MENDAPVEIRKKRGFPPPLGKVPLKSIGTFPHFPQARPVFIFLKISEKNPEIERREE
jgi:hypothetical protein